MAVWLPAAAALRAMGVLAPAAVPDVAVIVATVIGSVVVAALAALFGVWQSATAPSVRAIVESGGLLRLMVIVGVFFVGPWLLGLLSPEGAVPSITAGGRTFSVEAARDVVASRPLAAEVTAVILALLGVAAVAWLVHDTLRRCRREALALVPDGAQGSH